MEQLGPQLIEKSAWAARGAVMTDAIDKRKFEGTSVLLVEDNFLVGLSIKRQLEQLGCHVTGPMAKLDEAEALLGTMEFDCAVLDINIRGGTSEPLAEVLRDRKTPFFFITGYRSPLMLALEMQEVLRVMKPIEIRTLSGALETTLAD